MKFQRHRTVSIPIIIPSSIPVSKGLASFQLSPFLLFFHSSSNLLLFILLNKFFPLLFPYLSYLLSFSFHFLILQSSPLGRVRCPVALLFYMSFFSLHFYYLISNMFLFCKCLELPLCFCSSSAVLVLPLGSEEYLLIFTV